VLHVLPHPGGGGETYVGLLEGMPGYRHARCFLAPSASATPRELARGVLAASRKARTRDLVHVHGEAAAAFCLPLLALRPSVVTLHGLHLVRRLHGLRRRGAVLNLRAILHAADETICVSVAEHEYLDAIVGREGAGRAVVIRNGVELPPPEPPERRGGVRDELGVDRDATVAIWVGSLDERKDPLTAVHAAEAAGVTLLVVGDGPLRAEVEDAAGERVRVLGSRADVARLLGAADIYVLTSRREGLALSLLEAMAHGLPAIVTDLPENVEAVGDAQAVVNDGDVPALAECLRHLADDVGERGARGADARARSAELFAAERQRAQTQWVYDEVTVGRRGLG
jgi:glycosyltransferase involved in cell wall biosynthesis